MSLFMETKNVPNEERLEEAKKILKYAFEKPDGSVDLSHLGLKELPTDVESLKNLVWVTQSQNLRSDVELFLSYNMLLKFPIILLNLTNLSVLDLNKNYIPEIPLEIGNLQNLQYLSIAQNLLKTLPHTILKLKKLRAFFASSNPFLTPQKGSDKGHIHWIKHGELPLTLREISLRLLPGYQFSTPTLYSNNALTTNSTILKQSNLLPPNQISPPRLRKRVGDWWKYCIICDKKVRDVAFLAVIYQRVCKMADYYPFAYEFCSRACADKFVLKPPIDSD